MHSPVASIIIPTYKRPHLIGRAIQSAQGQTYRDILIMVLDNASNDSTSEIVCNLKLNDPRIQYICHNENIGMLSNYQYGLDCVKTDYFSFLSDDDLLLPNFVEESLKGMNSYPDIAFFATSTKIYSDTGKLLGEPLSHWPREGRYVPPLSLYEMVNKYPVPDTVMFLKKYLADISIAFENPVFWDCDFLMQIAAQYPIAISKTQCGIFNLHSQSFSSLQVHANQFLAFQRLIERICSFSYLTNEQKRNVAAKLNSGSFTFCYKLFIRLMLKMDFSDAKEILSHLEREFAPTFKTIPLKLCHSLLSKFPKLIVVLKLLKKMRNFVYGLSRAAVGWLIFNRFKSP